MSWYNIKKRRRKLRTYLLKADQLVEEIENPRILLWSQYNYSVEEEIEKFFKRTEGMVELRGARNRIRSALLDRRLMSALGGSDGAASKGEA